MDRDALPFLIDALPVAQWGAVLDVAGTLDVSVACDICERLIAQRPSPEALEAIHQASHRFIRYQQWEALMALREQLHSSPQWQEQSEFTTNEELFTREVLRTDIPAEMLDALHLDLSRVSVEDYKIDRLKAGPLAWWLRKAPEQFEGLPVKSDVMTMLRRAAVHSDELLDLLLDTCWGKPQYAGIRDNALNKAWDNAVAETLKIDGVERLGRRLGHLPIFHIGASTLVLFAQSPWLKEQVNRQLAQGQVPPDASLFDGGVEELEEMMQAGIALESYREKDGSNLAYRLFKGKEDPLHSSFALDDDASLMVWVGVRYPDMAFEPNDEGVSAFDYLVHTKGYDHPGVKVLRALQARRNGMALEERVPSVENSRSKPRF